MNRRSERSPRSTCPPPGHRDSKVHRAKWVSRANLVCRGQREVWGNPALRARLDQKATAVNLVCRGQREVWGNPALRARLDQKATGANLARKVPSVRLLSQRRHRWRPPQPVPTPTPIVLVTPTPIATPTPTGPPANPQELVQRVQDSIVRVEAGYSGSGSGFIFAVEETTAFVATNHHVIEGVNAIDVQLRSGLEYEALLLGWDADRDVAVLAICCSFDFIALPWEPVTPAVGTDVVAVGFPRSSAIGVTATAGAVAAPDDNSERHDFIHHTAPLNPGNSGGPLFSMPEAKVLGINTARGTQVLSFYAVPYQTIEEPMKEWRSHLIIAPASTPTPTMIFDFDTVEAGENTYTVNEVRDPAPASYGLGVGERLVAIDITIVALSDDSDGSHFFSVQDSQGFVYESSGSMDLRPRLAAGDLSKGQRVRGWVPFKVPEAGVLVSVLVRPGYSGSRVVIADLTRGSTR